jgi:hypothetical protein
VATYVLIYAGGRDDDGATTDEEQMTAWVSWISRLGSAVLEEGHSFGDSATVRLGEVTSPAAILLSGYTIVRAETLDRAVELATTCPVVRGGGSVHVLEAADE